MIQPNFFKHLRKAAILLICCLSMQVVFGQANTGGTATTLDHNKEIIGYLTQWDAWKTTTAGVPDQGALTHINVDFSKYTIINFSFFGVAYDGSLHSGDYRDKEIYKDGVIQQPAPLLYEDIYSSWDQYIVHGDGAGAPGLLDVAHQNGVKVMASIGGWSMCKHFPEMAADPTKKARFLADCQTLINMGFDGIDLDWEYPGPFSGMNFTGSEADFANFLSLVQDIRAAIGPDKLITAAMSAAPHKLDGFDWVALANVMDYFNMMTYDFNGGWSNIAGHNSPLYSYTNAEADWSWDRTLSKLDSLGVPHEKINMGMAFYGRGVICDGPAALNAPTLKRAETIQPDGPITTCADYTNWPKDVYDGTPNYFFIEQQKSTWTEHWDAEARVPYLTKGNYFLSYDNVQSISEKAQYVNDKQLAGVIVWTTYGDLEITGPGTQIGEHKRLVKYDNINSPLINKTNEVFADGGIPGNIKPTVSLTAPLSGESFTENVPFTLSADANDADGSIAKVEFYDNNVKVGEDATAPYSIEYSTAVIGDHVIKARAIDNLGDMKVSASASIIVELVGGGTCTAPQYVMGTTYPEGFEVKNNAIKYTCKVAGWCSANNAFYIPGEGLYWEDAWTASGPCGNQAPTASITSPADGSGHVLGTTITIAATATDSDGSIAQVEFFADATSLGVDTTSPYSIDWVNGALGTYSITAVATDDRGFTGASDAISVTISPTGTGGCTAPQYVAGTSYEAGEEVKNGETKYVCDIAGWCSSSSAWAYEPGVGSYWQSAWTEVGPCGGPTDLPPVVTITAPTNGATFYLGDNFTISATATDAEGPVSSVEFKEGTTSLGILTSAPYNLNVTSLPVGEHCFTVEAVDSAGQVGVSAPVCVNIIPRPTNVPPTVSLITPLPGEVYNPGDIIVIEADADDADGVVTQVEFFMGATSLGVDLTAPYSATYVASELGEFCIHAIVTDDSLAYVQSSTVCFRVENPSNEPPVVGITSPLEGEIFAPGSTIRIEATASDNDGIVTQVEFFAGATSLGITTQTPYFIDWPQVPIGSYALTAVATDDSLATSTSLAVPITVAAGGCTEPQYVAGTPYETGELVQNIDNLYRCDVGGWCSSSGAWAYEPGVGMYWTTAWTLVGPCAGAAAKAAEPASLSSNEVHVYPNPFDQTAQVVFNIEHDSHVSLVIFDSQGKQVKLLFNNKLSAGQHAAEFDASSLPTGLYIYRLSVNHQETSTGSIIKQ